MELKYVQVVNFLVFCGMYVCVLYGECIISSPYCYCYTVTVCVMNLLNYED